MMTTTNMIADWSKDKTTAEMVLAVARDAHLDGRDVAEVAKILEQLPSLERYPADERARQARRMAHLHDVPRVGDVVRCSWGYEQTNVDFYQVVAVTKASVKIRRIWGKRIDTDGFQDRVVPAIGQWYSDREGDDDAKVLTRRYSSDGFGKGYSCKGRRDYMYCRLWDGEGCYETNAACGH